MWSWSGRIGVEPEMPRIAYLQQVARQPRGDRPELHPLHPLLRRWQTLQDMRSTGVRPVAPFTNVLAPDLLNLGPARGSVGPVPPGMPARLPSPSEPHDSPLPVKERAEPLVMSRGGPPMPRPATFTPSPPTAEAVSPEQTSTPPAVRPTPTSHTGVGLATRKDTSRPAPLLPPAPTVAAHFPADRQPSRAEVPVSLAHAVPPQRIALARLPIDTPSPRQNLSSQTVQTAAGPVARGRARPGHTAPPVVLVPARLPTDTPSSLADLSSQPDQPAAGPAASGRTQPGRAAPPAVLVPALVPPPLPMRRSEQTKPYVAIGSLEIRIVPPVSRPAQPSPAPALRIAPSPAVPLARGFVSAFGLRQG
jgi:hypothetical protein